MMENDIKLVEFSATPNGTFKDSELWGEHSKMIKVEPGPNYTSVHDLKESRRVFQCKNLCDSPELKNIEELKDKIHMNCQDIILLEQKLEKNRKKH